MNLTFFVTNINYIFLIISLSFLLLVAIRYLKPNYVKNISYKKLIVIAVLLKVSFSAILSFLQYFVWYREGGMARAFTEFPLPANVPLPRLIEWIRPMLENPHGYFIQYAWTHYWLYLFVSVLVALFLYLIFKWWANRKGNFVPEGPELLLVLMITCGWPGILLFIPLGFVVAIIWLIFCILRDKKVVIIEPIFIISALLVVVFGEYVYKHILPVINILRYMQ